MPFAEARKLMTHPVASIDCQASDTCHKWPEDELRARPTMDAVIALIRDIEAAARAGQRASWRGPATSSTLPSHRAASAMMAANVASTSFATPSRSALA
jgi:hypothetical protein